MLTRIGGSVSRRGVSGGIQGVSPAVLVLLFSVCVANFSRDSTAAAALMQRGTYALDDLVYEVVHPADYLSLGQAVRETARTRPAPHMVPVNSCMATVAPLPAALLEPIPNLGELSSSQQDAQEGPAVAEGPRCECQVLVTALFDIGERADQVEGNGSLLLSGCFSVPRDDGVDDATREGNMKARCQDMFGMLPLSQLCGKDGEVEGLMARMDFFNGEEVQGPPNRVYLELEAPVSGQAPITALLAIDTSLTKSWETNAFEQE